jgi:hypothetical protein
MHSPFRHSISIHSPVTLSSVPSHSLFILDIDSPFTLYAFFIDSPFSLHSLCRYHASIAMHSPSFSLYSLSTRSQFSPYSLSIRSLFALRPLFSTRSLLAPYSLFYSFSIRSVGRVSVTHSPFLLVALPSSFAPLSVLFHCSPLLLFLRFVPLHHPLVLDAIPLLRPPCPSPPPSPSSPPPPSPPSLSVSPLPSSSPSSPSSSSSYFPLSFSGW